MKNMRMTAKLIIVFLAIGILGVSIQGLVSYVISKRALNENIVSHLESIREMRKVQIEEFYKGLKKDINLFSQSYDVRLAFDRLLQYKFEEGIDGNMKFLINTKIYDGIYKEYADPLIRFNKDNGFYDVFIISAEGHVMLTDAKESDLGENLAKGSLSNSHLAKAWKQTMSTNNIFLTDLEPYAPSNGVPAQFLTFPIRDAEGEPEGVFAIQVPDKKISDVMTNTIGLGESGETYLVGKDRFMRSDSRFQENVVLKTEVQSVGVEEALKGSIETQVVVDYRGIKVYSSYAPVIIDGLQWVILAEIDESEVMAPIVAMRNLLFVVMFLLSGVIIVIAYFMAKSIAMPLKKTAEFAVEISEGDLGAKIDIHQKDEVGEVADALRDMREKLRDILSNITTGAEEIVSASQQVSSTSQVLSQGANEQAASTEEVSSTMEEISSNISQNTDNAQVTKGISDQVAGKLDSVTESSSESLGSIRSISEKITIINDIAFQTNILALNAAVEAARAGDHGKGFAVVASEVRKLAERSKLAADEIVNLAQSSVTIAHEAGELMEQLVPEISKTSGLVQEIAAASMEQDSGATQVNTAIQELNNITQQNAAASEELATSAEELASQATNLKDLISYFKNVRK